MKHGIRIAAGIFLTVMLFCGSSVSAFDFKPVHVPGGEVSDEVSLCEALGGKDCFDIETMSLFSDVILDSPLVFTSGEYKLNGAGCTLIRGFEDGDLCVIRSGASVKLGDASHKGDGAVITMSGGTVSERGDDGTITRTNAAGLTDPEKVNGSLIRLDGGELMLFTGAVLADNYTIGSGGGVAVSEGGELYLAGGTIDACGAAGDGGGIYVEKGGTFSSLTGSVTECYATNGGGIYIAGNATLAGGTVSSCVAAENGGGLYGAAEFVISDFEVNQNQAKNGGGLCLTTDMILSGGRFSENSAVLGGALYSTSVLTIDALSAAKNMASDGGGIWNGGTLTISDIYLSENIAAQNGGGIWNGDEGVLTLTGGTFSTNSAVNGGGIFNLGSLTAVSGSFLVNSAENGTGVCNLGKLVIQKSMYFSEKNTIFLALGENGDGMLTVDGTLTAPLVAVLVPGKNVNGIVTAAEYVIGQQLLSGTAEDIKAAAAQFSVKESGGRSYSVDSAGCLKRVIPPTENPWVWIAVGGFVICVTVGVSVIAVKHKSSKGKTDTDQ